MGPFHSNRQNTRPILRLIVLVASTLYATLIAAAQDITLKVTYVCSGERLYVESCNIRDVSDTSTCMVGHPDRPTRNGLMAYTTETRGALKKLLPTCTQPSAKQMAAAQAFAKKQQDQYNANVQRANDQLNAATQPAALGPPQKPKSADERAVNRCITSGRLPASCTGNALLGAFGQMLSSVLPSATQEPPSGPVMAGVFEGAGAWRLDFIDGGVLVNCSYLAPNQQNYKIDFKNNRTTITVDTTPKPLVLTLKPDGTIAAPGPFVIDGVIVSGSSGGGSTPGHMETSTSTQSRVVSRDPSVSDQNLPLHPNTLTGTEDTTTTTTKYVPGSSLPPHANFAPKRVTCPALNLSSKGASAGMQTMQTDLLKTMFGGDKGPPTPPGIRMRGIYAASTGFSVQFFPESAVLGCGPDSARAYPYTVWADGTQAVVKIDAPDRPLQLALRPDGSLDGGSGPYQVHGRTVAGQNNNGDFVFAPLEQTCNLAVLTPSKLIPSGGGTAAPMAVAGGGALSTSAAPLGSAILSIASGFPAQPGAPNPLAGRPLVLLRDSYADALAKGGVAVPPGMSPYKYVGSVCTARTPECQKILDSIKANAISSVRADANGAGIFPGVPPGEYYLMISARYNNQSLVWGQAVQLKAGANSMQLDRSNAIPVN